MSKEEILEGNKLIATFMGGVLKQPTMEHPNNPYNKPTWWGVGTRPNVGNFELQYNSSWDWLIPVYIKIAKEEKLWGDYEESIIIFNIMYDRLGDAEGIDKVYESVVEFIKWYNQNLIQELKTKQ